LIFLQFYDNSFGMSKLKLLSTFLPRTALSRAARSCGCCAVLALASCQPSASQADQDGGSTPRIVTTTGMIGYMAQRISGTWATVESLMGPGVDPHLYRPSESDVGRLERRPTSFSTTA
jgi:manganese/zinc/iron transport system substrate-binding protein